MQFNATDISGVTLIDAQAHEDLRGSFARLWCQREFRDNRLPSHLAQASLSVTRRRHTLRGLHFQLPPSREDKLVRCVQGRIYDVALDLRPNSPSYLRHFGVELSAARTRGLFIPAGCAHGFLTLEADSAVLYMMTDFYDPELSCGFRWNDPTFDIAWPFDPEEVLERDARYPDFDPKIVDGFAAYS